MRSDWLKIYVLSEYKHRKTVFYCFTPAARVFYISLVFSNVRRVLSQCNTRLRLLYLLTKYKVICAEFNQKFQLILQVNNLLCGCSVLAPKCNRKGSEAGLSFFT